MTPTTTNFSQVSSWMSWLSSASITGSEQGIAETFSPQRAAAGALANLDQHTWELLGHDAGRHERCCERRIECFEVLFVADSSDCRLMVSKALERSLMEVKTWAREELGGCEGLDVVWESLQQLFNPALESLHCG